MSQGSYVPQTDSSLLVQVSLCPPSELHNAVVTFPQSICWLLGVHVATFQNKLVPSTHRVPWHPNHSQFVHVLKIESQFQRCPVTWSLQREERDGDRGPPTAGAALDLRATDTPVILSNQFVLRSVSSLIHCLTKQVAHTTCRLMPFDTSPPPFAFFLFLILETTIAWLELVNGKLPHSSPQPLKQGSPVVCKMYVWHRFLSAYPSSTIYKLMEQNSSWEADSRLGYSLKKLYRVHKSR